MTLVGQRLQDARRQVADDEDIALSVMDSFIRAAKSGRVPIVQDCDGI